MVAASQQLQIREERVEHESSEQSRAEWTEWGGEGERGNMQEPTKTKTRDEGTKGRERADRVVIAERRKKNENRLG